MVDQIIYDQHEHVINIVQVVNIDQNISNEEIIKSTCVDVQFVKMKSPGLPQLPPDQGWRQP